MGHIFGLPHDFGHPSELDSTTISLMGEYGSRHFRDYLWGGKESSVFSTASILQLMSHPLFAQLNKPKFSANKFNISNLRFSRNSSGLVLKLDMKADVIPYGVIVLVRPTYISEYYNRSFSKVITQNDSLNINIGLLANTNYALRLLFVFPNGNVVNYYKSFSIDANGVVHKTDC
jgi:hypothetical protein